MWKDFPAVFCAAVFTVWMIKGVELRSHRHEQIDQIQQIQKAKLLEHSNDSAR